MGYVSIKITDIQIPNDFRVLLKPDGGESKPYPIIGGLTWTDYGSLAGMPIYTGGTTEIWLTGSTYDFQYGTTYWIKLEEYDYPDRYVIKNIRIFDSAAYEGVAPLPSPTVSMSPPASVTPSVTRTASPTRTPSSSYMPVTPTQTPTETPSISVSPSFGASITPTPSLTPTVTPTIGISELYFASVTGDTAIMGINNSLGRTFSITFYYSIEANCDNNWSLGYNQATTYFFISENGGSSWNEINSVTAEVAGPPSLSDSQTLTGTTTITGITNVSQVRVQGQFNCTSVQDSQGGSIDVTITNVSVTAGGGSASIICNNKYHAGCSDTTVLSCVGVAVTPSATPSRTPTLTRTPSPSPEVIKVLVYNNSGNYTNITDVWVGEDPVFDMSPDFPLYPGDNGLGRSRRGTGTWDIIVYLFGSDVVAKKMTLIDSTGYEHCQNVNPGDTQVNFFGVQLNATGWPDPYTYYGDVSMIIEFFSSGLCPSPPPQTPSRTPSITKTPSVTPTIGLSPSRTPTPTPVVFGYSIEMLTCSGGVCGSSLGMSLIENPYYLTVGEYYPTEYGVVYHIISSASLGGDVTNVTGPGYSNCNDACTAMPS